MKFKLAIIVFIVASTIAVGTLIAHPGNGQHNGWPNNGITSPGEPNHYASPSPAGHP